MAFPSPADDYLDENIDLVRILNPNPPATFYWRVHGNQMSKEGIFNDDLLVVDRSLKPTNGDIVIAVINGERYLRRIHINKGKFSFMNNTSQLSFFDQQEVDVEIWGVVRCNIHWLGDHRG